MRPAGSSTFSARSASSTSLAVTPRAAMRVAIQPDAHRIALLAADAHLRHAVDAGQAVDDVALGVVGQLQRVHLRAAHVEPHDHVGVGLDLLHLRRIGFFRQAVEHAADRRTHVVGGGLDIAGQVELDADVGAAVAAARLDGVDALDAGERVFQDLGHAGFDHRGRGAGIGHFHRHHRRIDRRQFAQGQPRERHHAEHDQQQAQHGGEDGALDGDVGEVHRLRLVLASHPSPQASGAKKCGLPRRAGRAAVDHLAAWPQFAGAIDHDALAGLHALR